MRVNLSTKIIYAQYLNSFLISRCFGFALKPTSVKASIIASAWLRVLGIEVRKMADLLKSGATMLSETCPECGTPLFRKGKETFCAKCNKPVVIIQTSEDETRLKEDNILETSEQTLMTKIQEVNLALKEETDPDKLIAYGNALSTWLSAIEKLRKLRGKSSD
jgi:UPF0148 protein